ncbi:MAG: rRNA methyltransferase [Flavobacteriales bacterium]|nr:rRNA methyltransferase [Flavobacteriales bacterium]|tara:strand:- start:2623 stop:3339 length:717 start_codon:yes stop_codon:yes gene_type:complete
MDKATRNKFIEFLQAYVQKERREKFHKILQERTKYITVVLEDIIQSQNASAVIRSCDCFGIQDTHIIENEFNYTINPLVLKGANQWVNIKKYNQQKHNTLSCLNNLKSKGYRIVATSPHTDDISLDELDITKGKIALVMGNEREGISEIVKNHADEFVKIPMVGFSESFNISVSTAICLNHITTQLRKSDLNYHLTKNEKEELFADWCLKSTHIPHKTEHEFYRRNPELAPKKFNAHE